MKKALILIPILFVALGCGTAEGPDAAAADKAIASLDKMSPQEWFDNLQKQPLSPQQKIIAIDSRKNLTEADKAKFKELVNSTPPAAPTGNPTPGGGGQR